MKFFRHWGGTDRSGYSEQAQLKAIDYRTGKIRWSAPRYGGNSGLLSTAGNVLFGAGAQGIAAYRSVDLRAFRPLCCILQQALHLLDIT